MKTIFSYITFCTALLAGGALYAQKPVEQKTSQPAVQQAPRETRTEDKREELSKKLLERKNELRKEEHVHAKEHRNTDSNQKAPPEKKN
ncbi:MAG: hypothetical protein ABI778_00220 [Ignavibacteriota bacterium]